LEAFRFGGSGSVGSDVYIEEITVGTKVYETIPKIKNWATVKVNDAEEVYVTDFEIDAMYLPYLSVDWKEVFMQSPAAFTHINELFLYIYPVEEYSVLVDPATTYKIIGIEENTKDRSKTLRLREA